MFILHPSSIYIQFAVYNCDNFYYLIYGLRCMYLHNTETRSRPPLLQFNIDAFLYMQPNGVVDETEDCKTAEGPKITCLVRHAMQCKKKRALCRCTWLSSGMADCTDWFHLTPKTHRGLGTI